MYQGVQEACAAAGCTASSYDAKAQPDLYVAGFNEAIAQGADVVLVESIANQLVNVPMKKALAKGIKVVFINELFQPGRGLAVPDALVAFDYVGGSISDAEWVISDAAGKPINVAIFKNSDFLRHTQQEMAIKATFNKYLPGKVKVQTQAVSVADDATRWPQVTTSVIQSNPTLNYIISVIDPLVQYIVPAVHQAGAANRVKIATFNGTASIMQYIKNNDVLGADVGGAQRWEGWLDVDRALRLLTGNPVQRVFPVAAGEVKPPNRIFDSKNIHTINLNEPEGNWYDINSAIAGYKKLWGVA
jgi:ABC-type sugar transport system substrate-binding protein